MDGPQGLLAAGRQLTLVVGRIEMANPLNPPLSFP
jgi:hypothetical protein